MTTDRETSTRNPAASSSREAVLEAVRRAKPAPVPLPPEAPVGAQADASKAEADTASGGRPDAAQPESPGALERFRAAVEAASGSVEIVGGDGGVGIRAAVTAAYPDAGVVAAADPEGASWGFERLEDCDPAGVDVLVCRGAFGVAENGAVWLPESRMGRRAAPYLAQHLVIALEREAIVSDMHAAYRRADVDAEGFAAFVAGPSKTADVEQSLVIGAHGPRTLTVLLV